jgi:hypothetical protein
VNDFMAAVCVMLPQPMVVPVPHRPSIVVTELSPTAPHDGDEMLAIGYYRNLGVRADPDHVKNVLMSYIDDGDIHWGETAWREMDEHTARDERVEGVWYAGSRVYFSAWS